MLITGHTARTIIESWDPALPSCPGDAQDARRAADTGLYEPWKRAARVDLDGACLAYLAALALSGWQRLENVS